MAGGTWFDQNKVRPGVYINYKSAPASLATMGDRGVVAIGLDMNWGPVGSIIEINNPSECWDLLGYDQSAPEMLFVRQIFLGTNRTSGASKILVWRLEKNGAAEASATQSETITPAAAAHVTVGNLTCTAKTAGAAGNNLSVLIVANDTKFDVTIYENGEATTGGTFTEVENVSDLTDTELVAFTGTGALSATPDGNPVSLSGGANAVTSSITATAQYVGTRGDDISVVITEDPDNPESPATGTYKVVVQTLVSGSVVDAQEVSNEDELPTALQLSENAWVKWSGDGTLKTGMMVLSGGENGTDSATAYSDFLTALETVKFDVLAYDGDDATTLSTVKGYVKRLSNDEGRRCQCVVSNSLGDSECVISTWNQSVLLASGEELTPGGLTWWVSGCTAGAKVNESLTYAAHPDAIEISPAPTSAQQVEALNDGYFVLFDNGGTAQVLQDVNSFVTFQVEKGKAFRKNRVVRVIFGLCNDIYTVFAKYYIGSTNNNEEGRKLMKAEVLDLMNRYQANNALQNVLVDDVEVLPGVDSDAVVIDIACQPVDSVEKIYVQITIS